ncbi:hypothetical protein PVAP13_7KG285200 [Panicum virgatum]|uniref:Glycosyltransferase n=1 Tax=Panicum virgatum TaxID=38727 RepID=A0A8T0QP30_PANVG|nr:hypothetical protein PVAP13_7KG285200 [Panicum virgatum]
MESPVAVVAVPFPAQGHLNQLLHLSLHLASRGLPVHFAAPAEHVRQAKARLHGWGADALRGIQFHELAISDYESLPPDPAADSPYPSHLLPLFEAFVADAPAALLPNGEGFAFHCTAASILAKGLDYDGRLGFQQRMTDSHGFADIPAPGFVPNKYLEFVGKHARCHQTIPSSAGVIMNTSRALEGEFIDFVTQLLGAAGKKVFSIGPLNPVVDANASEQVAKRHGCLDWLDKQPAASVLYVSFGSVSSLRGEQIEELAAALRDSKQRFIWVLRDADRGNVFADSGESRHAKFMSEFTKQTEGTGLLITDWAPQLEILAHPATAAFLSHCGWNSTMESMSYGKPILAWPMHSDQAWDAELVCKYLKTGFLVRPCEKHAEVIPAADIREVIEKILVSEEGLAVRQRAVALGEAVRASVATGGSSQKELEDFVAHITR